MTPTAIAPMARLQLKPNIKQNIIRVHVGLKAHIPMSGFDVFFKSLLIITSGQVWRNFRVFWSAYQRPDTSQPYNNLPNARYENRHAHSLLWSKWRYCRAVCHTGCILIVKFSVHVS